MNTELLISGSRKTKMEKVLKWHTKQPTVEVRIQDVTENLYRGKRTLDFVFGIFGLCICFILYPFIAAGIKLSSPGPVLFKQQRTGYRGEIFTCYKFRTMHMLDRKSSGNRPVITQKGDKRIFAFGNFLRQANLDEFPQMLNVLNGTMSIVGPRPYPVDECRYWDRLFEDHCFRYTVTPGITGYAQVKGYRGGTLNAESMRRRLDYDLIYTEKKTILLDLEIILKTTLQMVLRKTNGW